MSGQPDFSTAPRRSRVPAWETLAVGAGVVALALAAGGAWRARDEARSARARLAEVRREVEAASARLRAFDARGTGPGPLRCRRRRRRPCGSWRTSPPRSPATSASSACSIDYAHDGVLEMHVVARDAASWDRLLDRLERGPWLREVEPGPEAREAEVRSVVRARWVGGGP